jgi:hypothetical protein
MTPQGQEQWNNLDQDLAELETLRSLAGNRTALATQASP